MIQQSKPAIFIFTILLSTAVVELILFIPKTDNNNNNINSSYIPSSILHRQLRRARTTRSAISLSQFVDPKSTSEVIHSNTSPIELEYHPTIEQHEYLEQYKYAYPSIKHHNNVLPNEGDVIVDVVSIGSESRFDYMTSQLQTWAATSRNFYGFTESTDFDPSCTLGLSDESVRLDYVNTCRLSNVGTKEYGIGHGNSGGWICAQRRVGKALGWLQAVYSSSRKGGVKVKRSIPDVLVIVDDDTSVDLNKVNEFMMTQENSSSNEEPYIAAGSVFQLGKYGGFKAAHGGFGTYLNRAAIDLMTRRPIFCNKDDGLIPTILEGEEQDPFTTNACTQLAQNKAQELDVYTPGDSVFNIFYKLASRPYFCMHSDWMFGYMVTNYGMTKDGLVQVDPRGKRGYCGEESVSCHYQTPALMEQFVRMHPQQVVVSSLLPLSSSVLSDNEETAPKLDATVEEETINYNSLHICDRPTNHIRMQHPNVNQPCPSISQDKPLLLLEGSIARGRTGNNLMELLHAIQLTKDQNIQLGMMKQSWAMKLVTDLWFETNDNTNTFDYDILERTLCVKIFDTPEEIEGWNVVHMTTQELFVYHSPLHVPDYMASQLEIFRRLFQGILYAGQGINLGSISISSTRDMCSGVNELFPTLEERSSAMYTVIHSRHRGYKKVSKKTGCDLTAALEMQPEYIKSLLQPLGMLEYPIVLITDGEDPKVLERLAADPDIGRHLRVLDKSSSSLGGEMTLAMMSQVFIGNPGSSLSAFIAKSRLSFGFEHNMMYMAKDSTAGQWQSVCDDQCLFDYDIMGDQA